MNFCQRHSLTLGRAIGFNRIQFQKFHDNLNNIFDANSGLCASDIYNKDEASVSTIPNKLPKVTAAIGKRVVSKVVSQERGESVTAVCFVSARGYYVPPALIFPGKRF